MEAGHSKLPGGEYHKYPSQLLWNLLKLMAVSFRSTLLLGESRRMFAAVISLSEGPVSTKIKICTKATGSWVNIRSQ